jgi:hypothetical protein
MRSQLAASLFASMICFKAGIEFNVDDANWEATRVLIRYLNAPTITDMQPELYLIHYFRAKKM